MRRLPRMSRSKYCRTIIQIFTWNCWVCGNLGNEKIMLYVEDLHGNVVHEYLNFIESAQWMFVGENSGEFCERIFLGWKALEIG